MENSFICDTRADKETEQLRSWVRSQNGEIKATHIVIQSEGTSLEEQNTITTPTNSINSSWAESASMAVLPVRCKVLNIFFFINCLKIDIFKSYDKAVGLFAGPRPLRRIRRVLLKPNHNF